jgi:PAS domain S-box-containing protein
VRSRGSGWSIRARIVLLVLGIVIPLGALGVYAAYSEVRVSATRAERGAVTLVEVTAANLRQFLTDGEAIVADLAASPLARLDPRACGPLLRELKIFLPQFTNVLVTDAEGRVTCSAVPLPDTLRPPLAQADWYRRVLAGEELVLGRPQVDPASGRWSSMLASPVVAEDGTVTGAVGLAIDLVRFQDLLTSPDLPPDAVITIDDLEGTVVARSADAEAWVGRRLPASGLPAEVLAQERGVTRVPGAEGIDRLWAFTVVPGTEWRVWAGIPEAWIYAPVREAAVRNGVVGLAVFLLVGLFAFSLYRGIATSLVSLVEGTRRAARGRPHAIPLEGPAEVVEVAEQFGGILDARMRAEERYRRAVERYRSIVENAVFGIYVATPRGRILEANPALGRILGCDAEGLKGRSIPDCFHRPEERARFETLLAERRPIRGFDAVWDRCDGSTVEVRLSGDLVRHGDAGMAYEVIAEDVSERRRLEDQVRQSQKLEAVGRLAGGVAHDFNNLLTVVTAAAHETLHVRDDPAGVEEAVRQIILATERGASLTRQLLAFSRRQVLQPRTVDLNEVVRGAATMLHRLVGGEVELRLEPALAPLPVRVDPVQMEQVLMNLVLNAKDATGSGGRVEIGTGTTEVTAAEGPAASAGLPPGRYATLAVRDDGAGIPPELHPRLFEPFFTTKSEGKGTGLGLATVYGIATQSGGQVDFRSEPGEGSEFLVHLPLAPMEEPPGPASREASGEPSGGLSGKPPSEESPSGERSQEPASAAVPAAAPHPAPSAVRPEPPGPAD